MSELHLAVRRYGHRALILYPASKQPASKSWQHGQTAATRALLLERHADANVGVLCGNGLVVIDYDPRHADADAESILRTLPDTFRVLTGGGGEHHYFTDRTRNLPSLNLVPGLELKARGAQVVAPPSIHPRTGRLYVSDPSSPAWGKFADLPAGIGARAPQPTMPSSSRPGEPVDDWFQTIVPRDYAHVLAGTIATSDGFICCPSRAHGEDRTPSLKLYDTAAAGWACYRDCCRQPDGRPAGGGIYQFAAHMLDYAGPLRGTAFLTFQDVVARCYERLLDGAA